MYFAMVIMAKYTESMIIVGTQVKVNKKAFYVIEEKEKVEIGHDLLEEKKMGRLSMFL